MIISMKDSGNLIMILLPFSMETISPTPNTLPGGETTSGNGILEAILWMEDGSFSSTKFDRLGAFVFFCIFFLKIYLLTLFSPNKKTFK